MINEMIRERIRKRMNESEVNLNKKKLITTLKKRK